MERKASQQCTKAMWPTEVKYQSWWCIVGTNITIRPLLNVFREHQNGQDAIHPRRSMTERVPFTIPTAAKEAEFAALMSRISLCLFGAEEMFIRCEQSTDKQTSSLSSLMPWLEDIIIWCNFIENHNWNWHWITEEKDVISGMGVGIIIVINAAIDWSNTFLL